RPYTQQHLDFAQVRELAEKLNQQLHAQDPLYLTESLWQAYMKLEKDRVHGAGEKRVLADLVSLVKHAALDDELVPYPEQVEQRYQEWLENQARNGIVFTPQQRWWMDEIARYIGINVSIHMEDLNSYGFQNRGGQVAAQRLFGINLFTILEELNQRLGD
ncbi:MAG: type I restriction-modification enzyme R subunit C-terminal domain-containing protein, partial [Smithella sp.]